MHIPALTESFLMEAAKAGWKFFSMLWDLLLNRRKTKAYEETKKQAYRELLKGDGCDWSFVDSVIAQGTARGDLAPDAFQLKSLHNRAINGAIKRPTAKRKTVKKPAAKKVAKRPTAKRSD